MLMLGDQKVSPEIVAVNAFPLCGLVWLLGAGAASTGGTTRPLAMGLAGVPRSAGPFQMAVEIPVGRSPGSRYAVQSFTPTGS